MRALRGPVCLLTLAVLWLTPLAEAAPGKERFELDELRQDFFVLRGTIQEAHPGLYRFNSKREVAAFFDRAYAALDGPMTELELYRLLVPVLDVIRCGHTRMIPSKAFTDRSLAEDRFLPLSLAFSGGAAWILQDLSTERLLGEGGRVVSIDGRSMSELTETLLTSMTGDGHIRTARLRSLAASFPVWYGWLTGSRERHTVEIVRPGHDDPVPVEVPALPLGHMRKHATERYPADPERPPGGFEIREDSIAVLTLRSLFDRHFEKAGLDLEAFLETSFAETRAAGVATLLLDLRGNRGGQDVNGKRLMARLIDREIPYYRSIEPVVRFVSFAKHTPVPRAELDRLSDRFSLDPDGRYTWRENPKLTPVVPHETRFDGRLIVLIDGRTFSGAAEVTALLREHERAVFVGEEAGGTFVGNNSGPATDVMLPNTGIRFHLPFHRYSLAVDPQRNPAGGVKPDHPVHPSVDDLLTGRDAVLEAALDLARKTLRRGA